MDSKTAEWMKERIDRYNTKLSYKEQLENQKESLSNINVQSYSYLIIGSTTTGSNYITYRNEPSEEFVNDIMNAIDKEIAKIEKEMEEI